MKKDLPKLEELIEEGNQFNFGNNRRLAHSEFYSEATSDFLSWLSKVEDYIYNNFDESSGPYKLLNSVNKSHFNGYYQSEFESELNKIKGAINSCKSLRPNKKSKENYIFSLIKNPFFWTVLVVAISASYKLGYDNGKAKFDNEKIEMKAENTLLRDSVNFYKLKDKQQTKAKKR